ncbi:hypothetical protein E2C01_051011 [Portunus trituberculatus]|uniref:Uncharacterized protein n=1 Tax=Portunus trituberculatus TaxID=210409 RepID=A0A5B7GDM4_PORTR|nr:hypothetical protein [Portunus trituberculatus]
MPVPSVCFPPQALRPELLGHWPTFQVHDLRDACKTPGSGAELQGRTDKGSCRDIVPTSPSPTAALQTTS